MAEEEEQDSAPPRAAYAPTRMGLEFLARVRRTTLWLGGVAALVIATYVAPNAGLGLAAGAAWSLVNLYLLERLVVALTGPDRTETAHANPARARDLRAARAAVRRLGALDRAARDLAHGRLRAAVRGDGAQGLAALLLDDRRVDAHDARPVARGAGGARDRRMCRLRRGQRDRARGGSAEVASSARAGGRAGRRGGRSGRARGGGEEGRPRSSPTSSPCSSRAFPTRRGRTSSTTTRCCIFSLLIALLLCLGGVPRDAATRR